MPIAPVGQGLLRSTAAELTQLQQQLAEVDPNDPQAIMQLQQQIAEIKKEPGPPGKDATLYMGAVETLPPGSAATATMVDGHLNLGIPEGLPGQDAVLELGSVTTGSQASAELVDGVLNLTLPEPVDGKDATLEMGTLTTLAPGAQATASIVDGKLNLGIPAGRQGVPGKDATLQAGTVTTGSPGQPASASIDGGILNLVIPQGQTGAPGAAGKDGQSIVGPAGPAGPVGPSGKDGAPGKDGQPGAVGPQGPQGPGLAIGMTTTGNPGTPASATISDNRLSLTIPRGDTGATGAPGKDATLAVGTTSTGAAGSQAAAAIVDGKLNLTIPRGDTGATGAPGQSITGPTGPQGPAGLVSIPAPTLPTTLPLLATAYQVSKTSMVTACADVQYTITALGTKEDIVELRIGPAADVATGGGILAASWRSSLTGITLAIGMGSGDRGQMMALVPAGWYWAVLRTKGDAARLVSALIQQLVP